MVFTSLVVVLTIMILASFLFLYRQPVDLDSRVAFSKVSSTNYFLSQTDSYISNIARISAQSAINDVIDVIIDQEDYFNNFDLALKNCLINGQFSDEGLHICDDESNLTNRLEVLINMAQQYLNIEVEIIIHNITFTHNQPWILNINVNHTLLVNDGFANWNISRISVGRMPIEGFRDVTYDIVHSSLESDKYNNTIIRGGRAVNQWSEIPSDLNELVNNSKYFSHNSYGVTFLNRLRGNHTASSNGILSIVKPSKVGEKDLSYIDWQFWNNNCPNENLIQYNFSQILLGERELMGVEIGYGADMIVIPESLAIFTNMTGENYTTSFSCD